MSNKANNQNKLLKAAVALLLIFVLLLGGLVCWFVFFKPETDKSVKGGEREAAALEGSIQRMSEEEIQKALNDIVDEGMFRISIASDIIAVQGSTAEIRIENNPQNRYVMQVDLFLDETGELIYSTDLIDPGYYIQAAKLDKEPEPGTYEATAIFTALYPDNEEIVGTVGANVVLHMFADPSAVPTPTPTPLPSPTPTPEFDVTAEAGR